MFVNATKVCDSNLTSKGQGKRIEKPGTRFQTLRKKNNNIHQKFKQIEEKPTHKHCGKKITFRTLVSK